MEGAFQSEKAPAGLDEHQVRRHPSWVRRVTLAMPAHAFLAVVRAEEHAHRPTSDDLVPLTCSEIQRLNITVVVRPEHGSAHRLTGSAGPPGDAASRRDHVPVITAAKPHPGHEDHDLQLGWRPAVRRCVARRRIGGQDLSDLRAGWPSPAVAIVTKAFGGRCVR